MLRNIYFDSKRLIKILNICKRGAVLLSGEEVRAEPLCEVSTCVRDGAQPTPGDDLGLDTLRLHLPCLCDRVEARCGAFLRRAADCNGKEGSAWLQGGSRKSISISL